MNKKKEINKDPFKLFVAESELTPETWDIAWGVDAMELGTSFSVDVQKKGQLKINGLPKHKHIKKGKPSHDAMLIAREIQAMPGVVTCEYKINKGPDGQLHFTKTFHGYSSDFANYSKASEERLTR